MAGLLHVEHAGYSEGVKFDPAKANDVLVAVRAGASNDLAARHAGVDVLVLRQWMKGETKATAAFREQVDQARADLSLLGVGIVRRAANLDPDKPNVSAATWLAEKAAGDAELDRLRELTT
jgi:hypothetical protein